MSYIALIILLRNQLHAGGGAAIDLVLQAGSGAIAKEIIIALAHSKGFLQKIQAVPNGLNTGEWPEITASLSLAAPMKGQPGIGIPVGQKQVGIGFIIPQQDIEWRPVLLDQILFQQQRLYFCLGNGDINVGDTAHQSSRFRGQPGSSEIACHPFTQVFCLANIEHSAVLTHHLIDAWTLGQLFEKRLMIERHGAIVQRIRSVRRGLPDRILPLPGSAQHRC